MDWFRLKFRISGEIHRPPSWFWLVLVVLAVVLVKDHGAILLHWN